MTTKAELPTPVVVKPRWRFGPRLRRFELLWLAVVAAIYVGSALYLIQQGAPLGHDEAVYSLRARHFVDGGTVAYFWNDYRAPGFPRLLQAIWPLGATEPFLRLVPAAFGLLIVLTTWVLGRYLFGLRAGLVAAAGVALTPFFLMSSTQVWPDVPGAALGLLAIAVLVFGTHGDRASWWIWLVAPLATGAVYVRYGAPLPIAIGLLAVVVWRWPTIKNSVPQVVTTGVLTLLGAGAVLFVPDVTGAGSAPFAAVSELRANQDFPLWQGFVDYAQDADFLLGNVIGFLLVAGLAIGVVFARQGKIADGFWMIGGAGVVTAVAIALSLHGEPRYLTPALPLLWIGAGAGIVHGAEPLDTRAQAGLLVALALYLPVVGLTGDAARQNEANADNFQVLEEASNRIDALAGSEECGVVTSYQPQVAWYSGCLTQGFNLSRVILDYDLFPDGPRYLMVVEGGKRQPEGELLDAYVQEAGPEVFEAGDPAEGNLRFIEVFAVEE